MNLGYLTLPPAIEDALFADGMLILVMNLYWFLPRLLETELFLFSDWEETDI